MVGAASAALRWRCSTNSLADIAINRGQAASSVVDRSTLALTVPAGASDCAPAAALVPALSESATSRSCTVACKPWQRTVQCMAGVTAIPSVLSSIANNSVVTVGLTEEQSTSLSWGSAPSPEAG